MASEDSLVKLYLSLGETERHFNTIQSNYRLIASTWTLACLGAIGFVLTSRKLAIALDRPLICLGIALSGSVSILILWLVDIRVYQQLLSMFYNEGRVIEAALPWLPQVREQTRRTFKGRLARAISSYYVLMFAFLCAVAIVFIFLSDKIPFVIGPFSDGSARFGPVSFDRWRCAGIVGMYCLICCGWVLWEVRPEKLLRGSSPPEDFHDHKKRTGDCRTAIEAARLPPLPHGTPD
jgi:hypothetical protein